MHCGDFTDWRFYIFLALCMAILPILVLLFVNHMLKLNLEKREMESLAEAMRKKELEEKGR